MTQTGFHHASPVYEQLPGWAADLSKARELSDLPSEARSYLAFLEEQAGCPISAIGVGPGRDETIVVRDLV